MNYFHLLTMLIAYYACRFGDLEREAQELGLQRAIEVICLFSKLYPCAIDDVTTIPFAQVCFMRKSLKAVYSKITKLNIQKLSEVYRKLKASYSSTTIPQVAK